MSALHIAPNRPVSVALVDPEGTYDFELQVGTYQTTAGETLILPRPAVIILNALGPRPGEEIQITQVWSGRQSDPRRWVIALSTRAEQARAEEGEPDTLTQQLEEPNGPYPPQHGPVAPPIPISAPPKRKKPETAAELFDRGVQILQGTGTYGPAPAIEPQPAAPFPRRWTHRAPPQPQIPANIAVGEILAFICADPNTLNWGDQAKQNLASTVIIAAYKAGHIGLWERKQ